MILIVLLTVAKILLVTIVLSLLAIYIYFQKQYRYWKSRNVPCGKPTFPFGSLIGMSTTSATDIFKKLYDESKHERYYGFWLLHKPALMVNDLDLIKRIMVENFDHFHIMGIGAETINNVLLKDLLPSLEGSKWKNLRAQISPIFTSGKLKNMFALMAKHTRDLQDVLHESVQINDAIDIKEILQRFMTDVISSTAFGVDINNLKNPNNKISTMANELLEPSTFFKWKFLCSVFFPDLAKIFKISLSQKKIEDFFMKFFRDIVDYREKNNYSRNDAMQLLIELLNKGYIDEVNRNNEEIKKNSQKFAFENLVSQAISLYIAGHETIIRAVRFALYELAMNQEIQSKLRKEIASVLAKYNGEITYEAVVEMVYLGRVINEMLRKYPLAGVIKRQCMKDFKDPDSDLVIEKNTAVLIPLFGLHMDERYYPNPEKFDPDRFTEENTNSRPNYTYLPFGEGPRHCIGQRLGLLLVKVTLIALLSKFHFQKSDKFTPASIEFDPKSFLTNPKGEIKLKISFAPADH